MPRLYMRDGAELSVQASRLHYSRPREDIGPYTHVEVGYPSGSVPDTWAEYQDGKYEIYAYLPIELVYMYVAAHGGIDPEKTWSENKNW